MRIIATLLCLLAGLPFGAFGQSPPAEARQIRWDGQSFSIAGHDLILIGGSMHYFRIPAAEWEKEFRRMQSDGFNLVDTYIPWFVHEPEQNKFNFDQLQRFLDLAREYNLCMVVRLGAFRRRPSESQSLGPVFRPKSSELIGSSCRFQK